MGFDALPYESNSYISAGIFFLCISNLAVIGRVYTRTVLVKSFGWDDFACLVTLVRLCSSHPPE